MTIENWGTGAPDYYKPVIASQPQVLSNQMKWSQSTNYIVDAISASINDFYTVISEYNLELSLGFISCKDSCINKLRIVADNEELIGDFRFDMQGSFNFGAGRVVNSGSTIAVYIYNNDTLTSSFSLTLVGVLMRT